MSSTPSKPNNENDAETCCGCSKQPPLSDSREPRTALPKTDEHGFVIHGPEVGHRPAGQTVHE